MKTLSRTTLLIATLLAVSTASVAAPADTPSPTKETAAERQQDKMKRCNAEAARKELKGDDRRVFMSTCLRG